MTRSFFSNLGSSARLSFIFALGCALLGGCATGEYELLVPIAGGTKLHIPIVHGVVPMTKEGGIQITAATFILDKDKKLVYVFSFTDSLRRTLRSVRLDDVSDETEIMLLTDQAPKLAPDGSWHATTEPSTDLNTPQWAWIATISDSQRVFHFTLTFADGQTASLYQCTRIPAPVKEFARKGLGLNY